MNGYYITENNPTVKIKLEPSEEINLKFYSLVELVLPHCKKIYCSSNKLTKLIVPDGCEEVYCQCNYLKELILPKSCKIIHCYFNFLSKMNFPKDCKDIKAYGNDFNKCINKK
jgi:hypothetical protein